MAWTLSPSHFWRFLSFARGQYRRTAPTRKIQNLSHFLEVYQRVEIYNLIFLHAGATIFVPFLFILFTYLGNNKLYIKN